MKFKELKNLSSQDRKKKLKELKMNLMKSKANASKSGSSKTKEIKKTIARILTIKEIPTEVKK